MAFEYSSTIEKNILNFLQGWEIRPLEEDTDETVLESEIDSLLETDDPDLEADIDDLNLDVLNFQSVKEIFSSEVEAFWNKTVLLVESYLQRDLDEIEEDITGLAVRNCIEMWCAGLLWKKYNLQVVDQEDDTNTIGYGDNLIITAKATLKPYRYRCLSIFAI